MIVPMKKVSIVVLDRERRSSLLELRRTGVVHLVQCPVSGPELDAILERKARAELAFGILEKSAPDRKVDKKDSGIPAMGVESLIEKILSLWSEKSVLDDAISRDLGELERLEPWGEIDPSVFGEMALSGVDLIPCELPIRDYMALGEKVRVVVLSRTKTTIRCLLFREGGNLPKDLPESASLLVLPEIPTKTLRLRVLSAETRKQEIANELYSLASSKGELSFAVQKLVAETEFEKARAGMELLTDPNDFHALVWLEGFIPEDDVQALLAASKRHGWAIMVDDPSPDDAVPTKLKNSALVRVVQPVFDFLGTVPNYREYDISAWFLLFFCFFFAMIFGDAGYGSILLISGIVLALKAKKAGKSIPDAVRLLLLLAGFTIFWGILTLSWFGIEPKLLPAFLKSIDLFWISNDNPVSGENVKTLCFYLGTVQLVIAHLKNIRRDFGSLKFLAQIGQLAMVIGMLSMALNLVISAENFPLPAYAPYMIAIGFGLNFLFASWESGYGFFRGILKSVISSFANIVSVFLGVVNIFADIVSYIRLWAVGLAGLAISQTVNNMVGPLLGKATFFVIGALVLILGHGVNIILSVLSVIVHGVRLNMLEFSGHLGMEWSGFSYEPFKERLDTNEPSSKEQS